MIRRIKEWFKRQIVETKCENCFWWAKAAGLREFGTCDLANYHSKMMIGSWGTLTTYKDFYCKLWRMK